MIELSSIIKVHFDIHCEHLRIQLKKQISPHLRFHETVLTEKASFVPKQFRVARHHSKDIHSKSWISWMEKSADYLKFSAEGLSGNAKTITFALSGELTLQFLHLCSDIA